MAEQQMKVGGPIYGGGFAVEAGEELPFVLPGERVLAGPPLVVLEPSPDRVEPGCVHFGLCGGCQYQHASGAAQVGFKQQILQGIFADAGIVHPAVKTHQAQAWGYRNRIRLRVKTVAGKVRVGYSRRGSNEFLPIRMCPIAAPLLWRAAENLTALAGSDGATARWMAAVSEVEFFCLPDESRLLAQFFLSHGNAAAGDQALFGQVCERLAQAVPELAGVGAELDPELNRRARRGWNGAAWGVAGLSYPVAGRDYWVGRGAFFQVNRFLVERLVGLVCDGQKGSLAWDLFAGVGLFTRALVESFDRVVAVEGGEIAAAALAIAGKGGKAFEAVRSPTLDFLRARALQRERPELIVLDPPRAGLGTEGAGLLTGIKAAQIVYVSCDPVTLARDLAVLVRGGYAVAAVDLIDLFPQTFHMETVVHLRLM